MRRSDREIKDIHEIESIISRADACRVAFTDGEIPYIVTMNFGYMGGSEMVLYFHCASQGRKLDMLKKNNKVCFQMDTDHKLIKGEAACDFGMSYSSIVGWGKVYIISDEIEKRKGLDLIMRHFSTDVELQYKDEIFKRTTILKLEISEISCKKR